MLAILSRVRPTMSKAVVLRVQWRCQSTVIVKKNKVFPSSAEAVKDIPNGASILVGGFGPCGLPENLITAVKGAGPKNLHIVAREITPFRAESAVDDLPPIPVNPERQSPPAAT